MEHEIGLMELIDVVGNINKAIDFIQEIMKTGEIVYFKYINTGFNKITILEHFIINDDYATSHGYNEAIKINGKGGYSYGYLKRINYEAVIFKFDIDIKNIKDFNDILKRIKNKNDERDRKKEESRLKHLDVDPYSEENWLEEKYIKKYKNFLNENNKPNIEIGTKIICKKGNHDNKI